MCENVVIDLIHSTKFTHTLTHSLTLKPTYHRKNTHTPAKTQDVEQGSSPVHLSAAKESSTPCPRG